MPGSACGQGMATGEGEGVGGQTCAPGGMETLLLLIAWEHCAGSSGWCGNMQHADSESDSHCFSSGETLVLFGAAAVRLEFRAYCSCSSCAGSCTTDGQLFWAQDEQ